jgi:hypothetical protein
VLRSRSVQPQNFEYIYYYRDRAHGDQGQNLVLIEQGGWRPLETRLGSERWCWTALARRFQLGDSDFHL